MNTEVARILYDIGEYLAMQEVPFKPRAYEKAARSVSDLEENVRDVFARGGVKALKEIPGVGEAIALKIAEYIETGKIRYYEELKKAAPMDLSELRRVEGLGPKSVRRLYEELGVKDIPTLEAAAKAGKIAALRGFGKKTEENILKSLEFARTAAVRSVLGFILPRVDAMVERLKKTEGVTEAVAAGSARRRRDTIGDIDLLAIAEDSAPVMERFVSMPEVIRVVAHGPTKSSVKIRGNVDVDLRVVPKESYGAALLYFTGSKYHNVVLRQMAIRRGWKLNEYGLFKGTRQIAGETEEGIYEKLDLPFIPPELRENAGEIEAAEAGRLPDLIPYGGLQGDLQMHSDWSDGKETIEAMARAAAKRGLKYIAITDHSSRLAMTNGLDEKRLLKQMAEIDRVNRALKGAIRVLKGTECDILKDGTMDFPDTLLAKLDVVGASIHSYFTLSREDQTARMLRAIRNPHVDIIFHPTGRVLGRREPAALDFEAVLAAAEETGTVLEVDAYPDRSDLSDEHVRRCVERGVKLAIDSDAHASSHFAFLDHGIAQARRGWAGRKDVVNAWPLDAMLGFMKDARP